MSGHLGDVTVSVQNLDIVRIDEARQLLLIGRRARAPRRLRDRAPRRQGQGQEREAN
jgi:hypothetical protein